MVNGRLPTQEQPAVLLIETVVISSFLPYSYGYGAANELKAVLKHLHFRFGPYSPTTS
jgi:hypothetical protein